MPFAIIPSFARGEIAPGLWGRVDTAVYHVGLKTARNVIIHASGGVSNRAGTKYIGPVKHHNRFTRLITFKYKATDVYEIEMGHLYMRFIRNDAHVLEASKNITGVTQANPCVVTINAHGYANGTELLLSSIGGMTQLNGRRVLVANAAANTFELTDQITGDPINSTTYGAYTSGGTAAKVYEITTPYDESHLERIKFIQSADVMTLTHPSYDPRELTRTGHAAWTLATISFSPEQAAPTALTSTQNGAAGTTTYKHKITAINSETLEESLPGLSNSALATCTATATNPVRVTKVAHGLDTGDEVAATNFTEMTDLNGRRFTIDKITANTFDLRGENGTGYAAETTGGTMTPTHVKVTNGNATLSATNYISFGGTAASGAGKYAIYRQKDGLYGLIGETNTIEQFQDDGKTPDFDSAPPGYKEPFRGTDNHPAAASYYEQRLVLGGTNNKPDTTIYSQVGNFHNLTVSEPSVDDDAITATLNSLEVNEIRHYIPLSSLLILTSGEEWRVSAGENSGFASTTLRQKPQSRWGCGHQRPLLFGSTVVFVPENNAGLRSLGYSLEVDGYSSGDLGLTAAHLFRHYRVRDSGLAQTRGLDPLCSLVREDGQALSLTFQQEQEIIGWARWDTPGGRFESVTAARPASTDPDEATYFVVRRSLDGQEVRYIERTADRRFVDIQDAYFVDCGVTVDSPITITAVTRANPCVVTAASHGLANGAEIDISDVVWEPDVDGLDNETQPDQLNGRRYTVTNAAANTFELLEDGDPVDSSAFNAYVSGGKVRATVSEVGNLWHLEGKTVAALANGSVIRELTVASGKVSLPYNASRAHVGIRFIADVELLNIEPRGGEQTVQGDYKHVVSLSVRVERTRGLWVGPNSTELVEWKQRQFERMGEPTRMLTGDFPVIIPPSWNSNGSVFFRQRDPLPFTITAVVPRLEREQPNDPMDD